jgi:replicative DNA helicase|tara:strand:- start:299 stop:1537 length:1239 start_codon:yes stop_codon:yes gene_type:complete
MERRMISMDDKARIGKVKRRLDELKTIKADKDAGKIFCIPFSSYPKLAESVPGIVPGMITMITAGSGVGKTQVTKALAVREPLEYALKNNIKLKIFYFALEESQQEFIDTMICNFISSRCNISMDLLTLQGYKEKSLDQATMDLIENNIDDVETLLENVEVIDSVYNPTGIYKYCRDHADKNGSHIYEDREFIKNKIDENGKKYTKKEITKVYSHYEPNDPNAIVIVVVDHMSLLTPEKDKVSGQMRNQHQTMAQWSTNYALKQITKHWGWAVVNVIQQEQSGEKEQFTNKGESIQKKTEPSLAGFANNKEIQRDAKVVIGVYSPDRYGFEDYHGYDVRRFRDTFRALKILKNRFGAPNKYFHYLFDGATNRFKELPKSSEKSELIKFEQAADLLLGRVGKPRTTKNFGQNN